MSIRGIAGVLVVAVLASAATTFVLDRSRSSDEAPSNPGTANAASVGESPSSSHADIRSTPPEPAATSLQDAVAAVLPSVVVISTPEALGSGVIVSADGLILTNRHVVACNTKVDLTFADGRSAKATVEGIDSLTDLAILRTRAEGLTPATLGEAGALEVGQPVAAIGNSLGYLANTVTSGIVSAPWRQTYLDDEGEYRNLVQTDAAIYGGNSGGALVNLDGEVVGINTLTARTDDDVRAQSLSFAIPSEFAMPIVRQAEAGVPLSRPWLGVRHLPVDPGVVEREGLTVDHGALVWPRTGSDGSLRPAVAPFSPAGAAGIRKGDVIVAIDGRPVDARHPLDNVLVEFDANTVVTLTIVRNGKERAVGVHLGERDGRPVGC